MLPMSQDRALCRTMQPVKHVRYAPCKAGVRALKEKVHQQNRRRDRTTRLTVKRKDNKPSKILKISEECKPNSCVIFIGKTRWRALVDTGADCSVISDNMYKRLKNRPEIKPVSQILQGAGDTPLKVRGITEIRFCLGKVEYTQKCYVVKEASRNMILGLDFLKKNNARIYLDLEKLRLNGEYVDLDQDIHIASVVRITQDVTLPPQTGITVEGKIKQGPYFREGQTCQFVQDDKSCMKEEPGLEMANSVSILDKKSKCKVMIVNTTNRTYTLKRGSILGTISTVDDAEVSTITEITKSKMVEKERTNLKDAHVPEEHRNVLDPLLRRNRDVFAAHDTDYGRTQTVTMKIDTQGSSPIKQRPYRTPLAQLPVVDKAIDQMLEEGVIERSRSPWASPIVLVKKKDGSTRFCVDYRKLNQVSKPLAYPLPLIDDLLGILGKARYFTSLDLISGYWQICMDSEEDKEKTAFCTSHRGLFQFKVMPFGLMNAPGIFSQLISLVMEGCEKFSTAYIDDILVFSETLEEHLQHLQIVFDRLRKHSLKLKLKKCSFVQAETSYLGYRLTRDGIKPEEDKVEAIRKLSAPTTKTEVRAFIGSCSYYRKLLPNFAEIARPIIDLTRKNVRFKWTPEHQKAFDYIKDSLTVIPFLSYPDMTKEFCLCCDASNFCAGEILTQTNDEGIEVPVYFVSHKLSDTQTR